MARTPISVGTIGHIDHGKTTLTSAILRVQSLAGLATYKSYHEVARGGIIRDKTKTITVNGSHVKYSTATRDYAHIDCPGHADFIKNMIVGAAQMDGAVLLLSAVDGVMPQTREHVLLARQIGVPRLVVFLNKCDLVADPELIDLVELEVRDLLAHYGYPDDVPVIRGSARAAHDAPGDPEASRCIHELLAALDTYVLEPSRDADQPLLLSVENVFSIEGRGTVASGKIERGRVRSGDEVEIVGLGRDPRRCVVVSVEEFNAPLSVAEAGQNVGLLLRGVKREEVERGHLIAAPRTLAPRTQFEAEVYVLTKEEGGRHTPFMSGYAPHFFFRTSDVTGTTQLLGENALCMPGDNAQVSIALQHSLAVNVGDRFTFREGGRTVGSGIITRIVA